MSLDHLMYQSGNNERQRALLEWAANAPNLHPILAPDYHRLQLEKWIWDNKERFGHIVMDVGQSETPRRWLGDGYFTLGLYDSDVFGDLLNLPLNDDAIDGIILTEVLEHCTHPFRALEEVRRVLRPGGLLFVTSPFIWPDHRTPSYPDYWRFTEQSWELLLKDFSTVNIFPCEWTEEGAIFWDFLRRFECFGYRCHVTATTGYCCEAIL